MSAGLRHRGVFHVWNAPADEIQAAWTGIVGSAAWWGTLRLLECPTRLAAVSWDSRWTSLSSSQFLRRQQVLQLYRKILRAIREVPAEADRRYLKDWAREEFRRNKDATDEDAIRMMITQGNMQLQELQRTLKLAKS
ncbi:LYR motif-containing protein 2 isoform X1 [Strigops habroptila]|uniref:LYR motif-containing protein 2 isoform X1 n=1 Tax=Strigops habroptila TaxID=2489341 RepID=UPI0011CEE050|nr:LYR motif-containing protein 2 isoform X1 [Strigops habroptila]